MVNYHILNNSIVLNFSGKTLTIASEDKRYGQVLACIKTGDLDRIPMIADNEENLRQAGFEVKDGLIHVDNTPIPEELNQRILSFKDKGLPFQYLLNFWNNLKQNPSYNSRTQLFKFLEHNGHPITKDGCFIAYRGVSDDFKDIHTSTFNNKPGQVCEMQRDLVDDNPNNTCSRGLHVACHDYAKGFGPKTVEVKVNPKDVVCVPTDYNGTKMRVCKFEVIQECAQMRSEDIYTDDLTEYSEDPADHKLAIKPATKVCPVITIAKKLKKKKKTKKKVKATKKSAKKKKRK